MARVFTILFVLFFFTCANAQSVDNLRSQRAQIEKEIDKLNKLLDEAGKGKNAAIEQINLYGKRISQTEMLINSYSSEIAALNADIKNISGRISDYEKKREELLSFYSMAVYEQWKARNSDNEMLYILASSSFDQAYRRFRYFREMKDFTKNKVKQIEVINDSLADMNVRNKALLEKVSSLKNQVSEQNKILVSDREKERKVLASIKGQEKTLKAKLNKEIANRKDLDDRIKKLIEQQVKKSGSTDSKTIKLNETDLSLAKNFAENRGKLPWPVDEGVVVEKFGKHRDPVHTNVEVSSDGISVSCKKNSDVMAVFGGTVTSVIHVPGMNNAVLIKHGNYFTLYCNLSDVYVKQGQSVTTKQTIGKIAHDSDKGSILQFQIWKDLEKLNPEFWLRK